MIGVCVWFVKMVLCYLMENANLEGALMMENAKPVTLIYIVKTSLIAVRHQQVLLLVLK